MRAFNYFVCMPIHFISDYFVLCNLDFMSFEQNFISKPDFDDCSKVSYSNVDHRHGCSALLYLSLS